MARDKTKRTLLALSREDSNRLGLEVEALIRTGGALNYLVNSYLGKYHSAAADTFGWTREDLLQHMRIILWKGMATFDPSRKYKVTTYLSAILYYQMGNFSKTCQSKKNSKSKLCFIETTYFPDEMINKRETPEDWNRYAQSFSILMEDMAEHERKIMFHHFVEGVSLDEMSKALALPRPMVVAAIKSIKSRIAEYMEE